MKDATAKERHTAGQKSMGTSAFGQIFREACEGRKEEKKQPQVIACCTYGYTKHAQPFVYQVESREYC